MGKSRRSCVASVAIAGCFALAPVAAGVAPAWCQDFSITNTVEPGTAGRRDVMRQLQAWWDVHGYYPRHASQSDEGGTVKLHLVIRADGTIFKVDVVEGSGSGSLDTAGEAAFRGGFVRPLAADSPGVEVDVSLHYVLTSRRGQTVGAGRSAGSSGRPFTITNDPVGSPILETMLQKTCSGTVVKEGIRNHPAYGGRYAAEAVFFRRPDGTPWVKFYEGGFSTLAPVVEVGKVVQWTGRAERIGNGMSRYTHYTVWPESGNALSGNIVITYPAEARASQFINRGGTVDFVCGTEVVPAVAWRALSVTPGETPVGDPP